MKSLLYGQLAVATGAVSPSADTPRERLAALINERVRPPAPLSLDLLHIRALRVVSDGINDLGGCFPRDEHARLCELLVDSPVLIGHDHRRLPVARNFAARCVEDGERAWVESWFYWRRGEGPLHDQLACDIDVGIVKEGSIGFVFEHPRCALCGHDIRACEHIPGRAYDGVVAYFEYRGIQRVLETSLVYRGATPGTRIVRYPLFSDRDAAINSDLPALLRVFPPTSRALSAYQCPARHIPWPRPQHRRGHGPPPQREAR